MTTGYGSSSQAAPTLEQEIQPHFAAAFGAKSRALAHDGGAVVLCHYDGDGNLRHIRASKVGENGVKPGVWYTLDDNGEFQSQD
jgi:hypothetical protein